MFEAIEESLLHSARIKVIGVGGGGSNAVLSMISNTMLNVDYIIANTDAKSLRAAKIQTKIQLGGHLTKGLGAGTKPEIGREAAMESRSQLVSAIAGADLVFIAAGMGGGTGTGAAPIIAEAAREAGILTVGIVTKPFAYEGKVKTEIAAKGIAELKKHVDSLIIIPNDRLISLAGKNTSVFEAFKPADDVLRQAVQGISELILKEGFMNLDFADVRTVMRVRGMAMMGIGIGTGGSRASEAVNRAISSPMLEDCDISGAKGVLVNITGSTNISMDDYNIVMRTVGERMNEEATIKIGFVQDDGMGDEIKVTVIATGFGESFDDDAKGSELIRKRWLPDDQHVYGIDNSEIPAYIRKHERKKAEEAGFIRPAYRIYDDGEDSNIPTFLRKKLD